MGVIYKLRKDIIDYVIEIKKSDPNISCRKLPAIIEQKFKLKVSKSSINSIIKSAGLSQPVGRKPKKRRKKPQQPIPSVVSPLPAQEEKIIITPPEKEPEVISAVSEASPQDRVDIVQPAAQQVPAEIEPAPILKEEKDVTPPPIELAAGDFSYEISEGEASGLVVLRAVDSLLGGVYQISEFIKRRLDISDPRLFNKTEYLVYKNLTESLSGLSIENCLAVRDNRKLSREADNLEPILLQENTGFATDLYKIIDRLFKEVRGIKISLAESESLYIDAQFRTIWSSVYIPYDFSAPYYNVNALIKKYFTDSQPIILNVAPGYDTPTKELFNLLSGFSSPDRKNYNLSLYGNDLGEIQSLSVNMKGSSFLIFAFWPWQFQAYRKVKFMGEFKPYFIEGLNRDFYLADIELELQQPSLNKKIILKGAALKRKPDDKVVVVILTNSPDYETKAQGLASLYLTHWPNFEEGFKDFSQKIEFFTYTASSQRFFSLSSLNKQECGSNIKGILYYYLMALELYMRWYFLPSGVEEKEIINIKRAIYSLKTDIKRQGGQITVTFKTDSKSSVIKELEYLCRRLNEREIRFGGEKAAFFI